jgi:serpin B
MSTPQGLREAVHADAAFGTDVYRKLTPRGNVVFSPASIAAALRMALVGARGETAAELAHALHLPDADAAAEGLRQLAGIRPGNGLTLRTPNGLWLESGLTVRENYLAILGETAAVERCDFQHAPEAARRAINSAVAEQTAGKITGLLPSGLITALTRLVLVNAVYLNAPWEHKFPADKTKDQTFYPERSAPTPVPLMHVAAELAFHRGDDYQAALLPYRGGALAMAVVLPDGPLSEFTASLDGAGGVGGIVSGLLTEGEQRQVALALPRFRVEASFRLDDTLQSLGVRRAFTGDADFSGICDEPLAISAVVHKAYIDVGEEGTEAAAATAVVVAALALRRRPQPDVSLVLDRPFLFVIADTRTGLPLFLGQFTRPVPRSPAA